MKQHSDHKLQITWRILRPPLHQDFELQSREELLRLKSGNIVKLIFQVGDEAPERMWVSITSTEDAYSWSGKLDNDPEGVRAQHVLKAGMQISFSPFDVISIYD